MRLIDADGMIAKWRAAMLHMVKDADGMHPISMEVLIEDLKKAPTIDPDSLLPGLVDKIASYLEREENWVRLKHRCWLIGDRSDELRELLTEALKEGDGE